MGCALLHKKESSNVRSIDYYKTPEGKLKKQHQNQRRKKNKPVVQTQLTTTPIVRLNRRKKYFKFISYLCYIYNSVTDLSMSISEMYFRVQGYSKEMRQQGLVWHKVVMLNPDQ